MFCRRESCYKLSILCDPMQRRSVISHYHWSQISGSQQSFLAETAIFIVEQRNVKSCPIGKLYHYPQKNMSGLLQKAISSEVPSLDGLLMNKIYQLM